MNTPQKKLAEELDRIAARYESQFAGMPRAGRNLDELDSILKETKSVLARIESIPTAVRPPEMNDPNPPTEVKTERRGLARWLPPSLFG